ncbi:hypothetical protein [Rhodococcus coprophilus]|uniref:Uncharacterized protein n=2 Tax=Rhodococcus coprophilus TaxID=38310 RepID=A0A2X4U7A9_9NOCA|nr:hypothetical protein [Rhodococcus coprophilus]SQI28590.1 Uncharacterised protein [Rhodococcus coprophilus]
MHEVEHTPAAAADAMTNDELETAIAALHAREQAFLVVGDAETASNLMRTKFVLLSTLEGRHSGRRATAEKTGLTAA